MTETTALAVEPRPAGKESPSLVPLRYSPAVARMRWERALARHRRQAALSGLWIAVLGSDGSGKTTLIDRLKRDVGQSFAETLVFHLRPNLVSGRSARDAVTDPHGRATYPWWLSALKIAYYVFVYNLGYLLRIRPPLARAALVLFDRYYDDLLVDPRRYRYGGPMALAALARRVIPRPHLFLILDVPGVQLMRRKREVSWQELRRQRQAYRELATGRSCVFLLDGSLQADEVARNARIVIHRYLEQRSRPSHESPLGRGYR